MFKELEVFNIVCAFTAFAGKPLSVIDIAAAALTEIEIKTMRDCLIKMAGALEASGDADSNDYRHAAMLKLAGQIQKELRIRE